MPHKEESSHLQVGESKQRDIGKKRARISPDAMDFLLAQSTALSHVEIRTPHGQAVFVFALDSLTKTQLTKEKWPTMSAIFLEG